MPTKCKIWYNNLTVTKQLGIIFLIMWFYWLVFIFLIEHYIFLENYSLLRYMISATWMASFMTIVFKWKAIKLLFKGNNKHHTNQNDGER